MLNLVKRRIASVQQRQPADTPTPPPAPAPQPPQPTQAPQPDPEPVIKLDEMNGEQSISPLETPPLTPASDAGEEGSTDEPSTEEPTVEEAFEIETTVAEIVSFNLLDPEVSSDESEDTDSIPDSDEEFSEICPSMFNYKIFWTWLIFWLIALAGGLFAYHINKDMAHENDISLLLMPREKWDDSAYAIDKPSVFEAERVIVIHTETENCDSPKTCVKLLNAMKRQQGTLKYNFLLATDGCIYEALGWQEPSPLYPEVRTMVIAFIGTYDDVAPSAKQLSQLHALLGASQKLNCLSKSYTLIGKKVTTVPNKLFSYLSRFKRWDNEKSDKDDTYTEENFEPFEFFRQ